MKCIGAGGTVTQETRLWDDRAAETRVMRSIEEAPDYRYFPEPDLQPLVVTREFIENVRASMPELPEARRKKREISAAKLTSRCGAKAKRSSALRSS